MPKCVYTNPSSKPDDNHLPFRIALGGTIGTGLFVGSGQALAYASIISYVW